MSQTINNCAFIKSDFTELPHPEKDRYGHLKKLTDSKGFVVTKGFDQVHPYLLLIALTSFFFMVPVYKALKEIAIYTDLKARIQKITNVKVFKGQEEISSEKIDDLFHEILGAFNQDKKKALQFTELLLSSEHAVQAIFKDNKTPTLHLNLSEKQIELRWTSQKKGQFIMELSLDKLPKILNNNQEK